MTDLISKLLPRREKNEGHERIKGMRRLKSTLETNVDLLLYDKSLERDSSDHIDLLKLWFLMATPSCHASQEADVGELTCHPRQSDLSLFGSKKAFFRLSATSVASDMSKMPDLLHSWLICLYRSPEL